MSTSRGRQRQAGDAVEVERDDRLVERRHRRRGQRRAAARRGVAVARGEDRGGRARSSTAADDHTLPQPVSARGRSRSPARVAKKPAGQAELRLAVVAVEASRHRRRGGRHASGREGAVAPLSRSKNQRRRPVVRGRRRRSRPCRGFDVVHVHAEDDRVAADHDRRRLDLVALAGEASRGPADCRSRRAAGAGREAPDLLARHRVERVHGLARADDRPRSRLPTRLDVRRAELREGRARLSVGREAPELAAVREPHGVDVERPRTGSRRPGWMPSPGSEDGGDGRRARDDRAASRSASARAARATLSGREDRLARVQELARRARRRTCATACARGRPGRSRRRPGTRARRERARAAADRRSRRSGCAAPSRSARARAFGKRRRRDSGPRSRPCRRRRRRALAACPSEADTASGAELDGPPGGEDQAHEVPVEVELADLVRRDARRVEVAVRREREPATREELWRVESRPRMNISRCTTSASGEPSASRASQPSPGPRPRRERRREARDLEPAGLGHVHAAELVDRDAARGAEVDRDLAEARARRVRVRVGAGRAGKLREAGARVANQRMSCPVGAPKPCAPTSVVKSVPFGAKAHPKGSACGAK